MKALFLNCTLKKSPVTSNTEALISKAVSLFKELGVESKVIRIVDHQVAFGVTSDEGNGDEWPTILAEIKQSDILILGSPIWLGDKSSVCKMVIERIDASTSEQDENTGQYPLYNKIGGVLVTGNEDGAKKVCAEVLFSLNHSGCTIPPNAMAYWVGEAGPGPSYLDAEGDKHLFTNKNLRFLISNTVYFAKLIKEQPITTNLHKLTQEAEQESKG
ncbi:flavodoxin family protein [Pontibacter qinzhouensis]|uniref:flavodoxin family protein n=1 Tax=Pontibacter qinzhouensis TaxID=2603253 RepID=UPI001C9C995F|nr:flavodoxin family protein [Pontibacter qinzhouensis]